MQWSDLEWVSMHQKVARRATASDLLACVGPLALFPPGTTPPALRPGVWVTTTPMTETVKRVGTDGMVQRTVPRHELLVAGFPVVVPASLLRQASDPEHLLRLALAGGEARELSR